MKFSPSSTTYCRYCNSVPISYRIDVLSKIIDGYCITHNNLAKTMYSHHREITKCARSQILRRSNLDEKLLANIIINDKKYLRT